MNRNELYHEEEIFYKKHSKEKHGIVSKKRAYTTKNKRMVDKFKKHKITKIMLGKNK